MKQVSTISVIYCTFLSMSLSCMLVKLDDKTIHHFSQEEIEFSALLLKKKLMRDKTTLKDIQKWGFALSELSAQLPDVPSSLHGISSSALQFFKKSITIKSIDFHLYFNDLSKQEQDDLLSLSSEKQFGSPLLFTQIMDAILPHDIINKHIKPYLNLREIIQTIRSLTILDNAQTHNFTHEKLDFNKEHTVCVFTNGFYTIAPLLLLKNQRCLFSINPYQINTYYQQSLDHDTWTILALNKKHTGIVHYITKASPDKNVTNSSATITDFIIWTCDLYNKILHKKTISHHTPLLQLIFSDEQHTKILLASQSGPYNNHVSDNIIITSIGNSSDESDFPSIKVAHQTGRIFSLVFNPKTTLLVAGTEHNENSISIYNSKTGQPIQYLNTGGTVHHIAFTPNGNKMISCSFDEFFDGIIHIWNSTNDAQIDFLTRITIGNNTMHQTFFNNTSNRMIGVVNNGETFLLDINNNDFITLANNENSSNNKFPMAAFFTPDNNFFITTVVAENSFDSEKKCHIQLWNAHNGNLLATLLPEQTNVCGIGITPNKQYIITTFTDNTYIKTALFNQNTRDLLKNIKYNAPLYAFYNLMRSYHINKSIRIN